MVRVSESPFSTFTLWQYRNLAVLCLVGGALFLGFGGTGFEGGCNVGMGLTLLAAAGTFVALRRYVGQRLHLPAEFWREQQRRVGPAVWTLTSMWSGVGLMTALIAWLGGARWISGLGAGLCALPLVLVVGKLTGQVRDL
jgi:hypothetical protein